MAADELAIKLHSTTDAQVWAEEFVKQYPQARRDVAQFGVIQGDDWLDTVHGWFANAIETGRDAGYRACAASHDEPDENVGSSS